jgi:hypothetical protein
LGIVNLAINRGTWRKIWNFVLFQIGWFACILGAAHHQLGLAIAVALICIGVYLWLHKNARSEHELLLKVFIYGLIADTILVQLGWIRFESDSPFAAISPVWMWALWLVFATTLKESMAWLQGKNGLAAILGAIAGPLCYEAGVRLGAASWPNADVQVFALIYLAVVWAIAMPVFLHFAKEK